MELALTNNMLKQAGEEAVNNLLEGLGFDKEQVISVRLDTGLAKALEAQAKAWGLKNTSTAVRTILSFYFLPAVYQLEWKDKDFGKLLKKGEEYSTDRIRANYFLKALVEYMSFLEQTLQASSETLSFVEGTQKNLNAIIEEMTGKMKNVIQEVESKQGAE